MFVKKLQYVEHLLLCKYICNIFPNSVEVFYSLLLLLWTVEQTSNGEIIFSSFLVWKPFGDNNGDTKFSF